MTKWCVSSLVVSGLLGGSWFVLGQSPMDPQYPGAVPYPPNLAFAAQYQETKQPPPPMAPPDKKQGDVPDPTLPGPGWQQIFAQKGAKGAVPTKIPNVLLRGRVLSRDKPAMAIIEVDGRTFMVGKDSMLTSAQIVMEVVDLNAAEVRIEISPSNEIIILR